MPSRISRSSLPSTRSSNTKKIPRKRKERSLNALAIAEKQAPLRTRIRQHRLGEAEIEEPGRKRQRLAHNDEEEDDPSNANRLQRKNTERSQSDDHEVESGNDSEGHEWRVGVVDDEDDSDLDSDEAFGESDEERFEGFTFRGSSSGQNKSSQKRARMNHEDRINLDEDVEEHGPNNEEEELGEDAVDLATMLDQEQDSASNNEDGAEDMEGDPPDEDEEDDEAPSEADGDESMSDFSFSDAGADDNNPAKLRELRSLASSMAAHDTSNKASSVNISQSSPADNAARMIQALKNMPGVDPTLTRSIKKLTHVVGESKKGERSDVVKIPLPKRQQDRIDRGVAYSKAKETLNRWIDTVKHNRRAEHLTFPLPDPEAQEPQGTSRLLPIKAGKPQTELESTIQDIMRASGLGGSSQKSDEEQIREFEELQANKVPLEEVMAQRAELRKARDLLFREERRAKRIAKIKSKAYRRVHRKEVQRNAQKERDLLAAAGVDLSEDEKEANDRRRAEERMGARHRESRWAKSVKQTGRAGWDDDARDAVTGMARKNEELRRRMEGKRVRNETNSDSDDSAALDGDTSDEDEDTGDFRLRRQIDKVKATDGAEALHSKLGALKFMQRADAARKQQNDETAEQLRQELFDDENQNTSEAEEEKEPPQTSLGRRIFGVSTGAVPVSNIQPSRNELEEGSTSEDENERDAGVDPQLVNRAVDLQPNTSSPNKPRDMKRKSTQRQLQQPRLHAKPFVATADREDISDDANPPNMNGPTLPKTKQVSLSTSVPNTNGWTIVHHGGAMSAPSNDKDVTQSSTLANGDDDNNETDSVADPLIPSNHDLVRLAFGDAGDESSFAAEKAAAADSEDEKTISTALPGWGSWTGDGISKRSQKRTAQKQAALGNLTKTVAEGVRPANRRDMKLKDVIMSERRITKNAKYLAGTLPFPYESRAQYERSLRVPIGPEWNTKIALQDAVKPRVMVKRGVIVEPMKMPMM